jgi:L-arabinokinase
MKQLECTNHQTTVPRVNETDAFSNDDFAAHVERLRRLPQQSDLQLRTFFAPQQPIYIARAPGRLDLMGGIADYSGSLVLEMPIAEAAFAAVQLSTKPGLQIASLNQEAQVSAEFAGLSANYWQDFQSLDYDAIGAAIQSVAGDTWPAYILGPIVVFLRETESPSPTGLRVLIDSQVPEGKGVSSSAAVEVATMRAVAALLNVELSGEMLARLCQLAENRIAGAPCGIMDQMTSALGRSGELLALRCQPASVEGFVRLPAEIGVWGIDSGIRHAVGGSNYSSVRCSAFMGYRMIADAARLRIVSAKVDADAIQIEDPYRHGYLANINTSEFSDLFEHVLPLSVRGAEFLAKYSGTTDHVTRVDPNCSYAVRACTRHPIEENARVERFRFLLDSPVTEQSLKELGELMYASHASYSACGLGSDGTDTLVEMVRSAGPASGLSGAKITGGGSGGTVVVLGRADAGPAVERIAQRYSQATRRSASIFRGSSAGACAWPVEKILL